MISAPIADPVAGPVADLVVIGAGPAGCALALRAARRGARVVLCEQHRGLRDRLCGEVLSPRALGELESLGLLAGLEREAALPSIERVRVTVPGGPDLVHPLAPPGRGLARLRLDGALAAAAAGAGVELRAPWRAVAVRRSGDADGPLAVEGVAGPGGRERLLARAVAGSFGKDERLPAAAGQPEDAGGFIAWKAHHRGEGPSRSVELHAFAGGYLGVAPIEGGRVNVCGLATRAAFRRAGSSIEGLAARAARENPAIARRLAGLERVERTGQAYRTAARLPFGRRRPVAADLLLLGDAAALVAPLSGDGIGLALASAALADAWVAGHLEGRIARAEMLAGYAREWRRAFGLELRLGEVLQGLILRPRAAAWVTRASSAAPALAGWLVRHARASDRAPDYRRR